jgi:adenosine/AMP kinase
MVLDRHDGGILGVEDEEATAKRRDFLRMIGYKLK